MEIESNKLETDSIKTNVKRLIYWLQANCHLGDEVKSRTRMPFGHSEHEATPVAFKPYGQDGCVH